MQEFDNKLVYETQDPKHYLIILLMRNNQLVTFFTLFIFKVIRSADTWIITGGTHSGVSKTVAKIFRQAKNREFRNACIGITPWGCVKGKEQLISEGVGPFST